MVTPTADRSKGPLCDVCRGSVCQHEDWLPVLPAMQGPRAWSWKYPSSVPTQDKYMFLLARCWTCAWYEDLPLAVALRQCKWRLGRGACCNEPGQRNRTDTGFSVGSGGRISPDVFKLECRHVPLYVAAARASAYKDLCKCDGLHANP